MVRATAEDTHTLTMYVEGGAYVHTHTLISPELSRERNHNPLNILCQLKFFFLTSKTMLVLINNLTWHLKKKWSGHNDKWPGFDVSQLEVWEWSDFMLIGSISAADQHRVTTLTVFVCSQREELAVQGPKKQEIWQTLKEAFLYWGEFLEINLFFFSIEMSYKLFYSLVKAKR